ncbi:ABC transporter permease [bacterium]|nr:ABC transporter permease [bacterium]
MFKNQILVIFRNMKRQKIHFLIMLTGLAAGLSVSFFCTLFVVHELRYDGHHDKGDRIYRMITRKKDGGYKGMSPVVLKEALEVEFPEIEAVAQISQNTGQCVLRVDGRMVRETSEVYADPEIFSLFNLPLLHGDAANCLSQPVSLVISERMARRYFPSENPMNRPLDIRIGEQFRTFTVTGVLKPVSRGTFLDPDILLPKQVMMSAAESEFIKDWSGSNPQTFVLLRPHASEAAFREKLPSFSETCQAKGYQGIFELQPFGDMHLRSGDIWGNMGETGNISTNLVFAAIGLLILGMGCINYINLSTAQSVKRVTEIGIRKVIGAGQYQIRIQYLTESMVMTLMVLPFALGLLELFLPFGNRFVHRQMDVRILHDFTFMACIVGLTLLVGFISGSYNAFYVGRMEAVDVFRSGACIRSSKSLFRKGLLILQFSIFCVLIICSLTMVRQMRYIQHKKLGYNKEQLVSINFPVNPADARIATFKNEIMNLAGIENVSVTSFVPPAMGNWLGTEIPDPQNPDKNLHLSYVMSDLDYLETVGLGIQNGRNYSDAMKDMSNSRLVLNETAVRLLNIDSPVGSKITMWSGEWEVIGVIQDFHTHSLHSMIPALFFFSTDQLNHPFFTQFLCYYAIRLRPGQIPETLRAVRQVWERLFPDAYFDVHFADDEFGRIHRDDRHLSQLLLIFTVTAVLINCMGLFGLISMTSQSRLREIGIRKTLGASTFQIFSLLTREYLLGLAVSIVIAVPAAVYIMGKWLQQFAYQAPIGWPVYGIAAGLAVVITLVTLSGQAVKATRSNPVESLRYE